MFQLAGGPIAGNRVARILVVCLRLTHKQSQEIMFLAKCLLNSRQIETLFLPKIVKIFEWLLRKCLRRHKNNLKIKMNII